MVIAVPEPEDTFDDDAAWCAVLARDRDADGRFVFAVRTTGIYCRPSCPARRPERHRVAFYPNGGEATVAGFRPCRRCHPDQAAPDQQAVQRAIGILSGAECPVPLAVLAAQVGYSPSHLQRLFTRAVGLSPAAYFRALRRERAAEALDAGTPVAEAIYAAGYGAPSRFYADVAGDGLRPAQRRAGGEGALIHWAIAETTLGPLLVAATERGLCRVTFGEDEQALARRFPRAALIRGDKTDDGTFAALLSRVVRAVENPGEPQDLPLDLQGTAFQKAVWRALQAIPAGETRSYAQIAAEAGKPTAIRAAGSANGANPVAVIVPCHRVVRADGTIGGYAWGEPIKRELLKRERG